jgi:hypothetical protein
MGNDSLDENFYENLDSVIIIGIKKDNTVNVRTNVYDKQEFQKILTTAMMMSALTDFKNIPDKGIDNLH